MRKYLFFFLCAWLALPVLAANDIVRVSATLEYVSDNPNETPAQAETKAFEAARIKALEEKFGLDVSSVSNTLITSRQEGQSAKSQQDVFAIGGTSVRGEWIETIKEEVLAKNFTDGFWIVKVHVEGRARSYSNEKADIRFALVNDEDDMESPVAFRDGSPIFLRFSSPVPGNLCVYIVDAGQNAFCLLPYPHQQTGAQVIEANKEYLFFTEDKYFQGYKLFTDRTSEQNALYVIFSPNKFIKANDKEGGVNTQGDALPRELSYEAFLKWLTRNQTKDPDMVVRTSIIAIRK